MEDFCGPLLCRVCLDQGGSIPIFETKDSPDPEVYSKLCQCIGGELEDIDGYPRQICKLCHITLNTAIQFIRQFHESTEVLSKCQQQVMKQEPAKYLDLATFEFEDIDDNIVIEFADVNANDLKIESEVKVKWVSSLDNTKTRNKKKSRPKNMISKNTKPIYQTIKTKDDKMIEKLIDNKVLKPNENNSTRKLKDNKNFNTKENTLDRTYSRKLEDIAESEDLVNDSELDKNEMFVKNPPSSERLCDICGLSLANADRLYAHRQRKHSVKPDIPAECLECHKVFVNQHGLRRHKLEIHTPNEEKDNICPVCGRRFKLLGPLTAHVKSVHGKKNIAKCHLCDKEFYHKISVKNHIKSVHTGERTEVCSVCGKAFAHPDYLKEHMRLHTGERPFACLVCGKAFAQRGNLKSHIRHNHRVSQLDEEMLEKLKKSGVNYFKQMKP